MRPIKIIPSAFKIDAFGGRQSSRYQKSLQMRKGDTMLIWGGEGGQQFIQEVVCVINFNINLMKKSKADKCTPQAITLSSKRGSLNQEQLFVPYKIDWKAAPLQTVENGSSRAFFQNMKAELSNIKNDFEKLIRKEGPEWEAKSSSKPKCQSAYKKDPKKYPENERLELVINNRQENDFFKILNLEKNLPCTNGSEYKNICSKTINVKDLVARQAKSSPFENIDLQRNQRTQSSRAERPPTTVQPVKLDERELANLRETVNRLQGQLKETQDERDFTSREAQRLFAENNSLMGKMGELSSELGMKMDYILKQEQAIQGLHQSLQSLEQQRQQWSGMEQEFANQRQFYNERINELMFHNQNLGTANIQLSNQNQMLKENCENLQRFVEELQRRGDGINADNKRKLEYLQRDIQEYQKREDMFSKEIQKLNQELLQAQQTTPIPATTLPLPLPLPAGSQQELIAQLNDQILHLRKQVAIEKQIHAAVSKRYQEQIASLNIQQISREFEEKTHRLIDENCKLKTKLNLADAALESLNQQHSAALAQIAIYEERDQSQPARQLTASQWEHMTEQIEALQVENQRLKDELEVKGAGQGEEQCEVAPSSSEALIRMANLQLLENEQLKDNIRELAASLKQAEQKLQTQAQTQANNTTLPSDKRVSQLEAELAKKREQVLGLKQVVFRVLVQKAGKLQDEQQMQFYLRQLDERRQQLTA